VDERTIQPDATTATKAREAWLQLAATRLVPLLSSAGAELPEKVRYSCGWPGGRSTAIGSCWSAAASATKHREIFVSPVLDNTTDVLSTLLHEMIHAALPDDAGHGKEFRKLALACGFEPPMRTTPVGEKLRERLNTLVCELPPYPHSKLSKECGGKKKQTTRMIKLQCPACEYVVRTTAKWMAEGVPTCHCGETFQEAD
jgi:hypothetical protein